MKADRRKVSIAAIGLVGLAVLQRLRNTRRTSIAPKLPPAPIATPPQNPPDDIHRIFWERSRANRFTTDILLQAGLWSTFLTFGRGSFPWTIALIPYIAATLLSTTVLISVTRFGSNADLTIQVVASLSSVTAIFSTLYWNYGVPPNFTQPLTRIDAIYFTIGTLTTAGSGNISATSEIARILQGLQMILDVGLVVFAVAIVVNEFSSRMQKS